MKNKDYRCVTLIAELEEYLKGATVVAFDYETAPDDAWRDDDKAALDPHRAHVVGCSYSVAADSAIYVPIAHKSGRNMDSEEFWKFHAALVSDPTIIKVCHNINFEAAFTYAKGIVIQAPVYDTMAAAQMTLCGDTHFRTLKESGLKYLAQTLLDEDVHTFEEVSDGRSFDELNAQDPKAVRYGCGDSDYTLQLRYLFNEWFDVFLPRHRWIVENIESPTAVYLGVMKYNGAPVDKDLMLKKKAGAEAERKRLADEIAFMIGDVKIGSNCSTKEFKSYLYDTLGLPVMKTTATDKAAADDQTMQMLQEWCNEHRPDIAPLFKLVQEYRKWGKIESTYIDGYLKYLNPVTGRLHPNFFALSKCCAPSKSNRLLSM